ncbi:MAG TPA: AMP-dependent synthetase/ligase [Gemmatales bacterium]|nr:AMP-dependent synthetase/ligase [Gemmatales bacterium]
MNPEPTTLIKLFLDRAAKQADRPAVHFRHNNEYLHRTWAQLADDVGRTAVALKNLGVEKGDRVMLISPNRYEWVVLDMAILAAGGINVPVHVSLSGPQMVWQINHSGAKTVIVADKNFASMIAPHLGELKLNLLSFDECRKPFGTHRFTQLNTLTRPIDSAAGKKQLEEAAQSVSPSDVATIIYTSGTTGEPKGAMLTQNNLASNCLMTAEMTHALNDDIRLTWLPMSHIFARTCDLYGILGCGYELALADSTDTILENCAYYRPTLMNGVPYFYEKVMNKLIEAKTPGMLQHLFGGRLRVCVAGGAPLPEHVATFYREHGVFLLQGYGLTESSPVISGETPDYYKTGTVGQILPGIEVKIAPDGEILSKGPNIMLGYWNNPTATDEAITDGWLHTGDLGSLDSEGYLKITGRKKELIVTSAGKNIAPVFLESLLKADPLFMQVVVIGDRRKFLTALIVPGMDFLKPWAAEAKLEWTDDDEMLVHPQIRQLYAERISTLLKDVAHHEQIRNFALIARPFSVETDELTLTLKLRRGVITKNYSQTIEQMYMQKETRVDADAA